MTDPIPPGELTGLEAFRLRVEAQAGQRYPERPVRVELDGQRIEVASVDSEWREEDRLGFRIKLRDGKRMLLYYVPSEDLWSGVVLT
ncbi:MAG: hypothetical protein WEB04_10065 [Dehalococcoidia bacterium]